MANTYTLSTLMNKDRFLGDPTSNKNFTCYRLALSCEGTNGASVSTTCQAGDISNTDGGTLTISGTWTYTNSNPSVGTTSIALPSSGYIRVNTSNSFYMDYTTILGRIRFSSIVSAETRVFGVSSNTSLTSTNTVAVFLDNTGKVGVKMQGSPSFSATHTQTLSVNTWHYISVTTWKGNVWLGVDGTVEQIRDSSVDGGYTGFSNAYPTIRGDSTLNTAGLQIDDVIAGPYHIPKYAANFTPTTNEQLTEFSNTSSPLLTLVNNGDSIANSYATPIVQGNAWFLSLIHISEPTRPY